MADTMTAEELQAQWEAEEAEREAERIAAIERQIAELSNLKSQYVAAKISVEGAESQCSSESSSWSSKIAVFAGKVDEINKTDLFEGEISERMREWASDIKSDLDNGIACANSLDGALGSQVGSIEARIAEIEMEISALRSQI